MAIPTNKRNKRGTSQATFMQSERWLRAILAQSYDAIVLTSADGTNLFASPSIQRVIGYTAEEYMACNGAQLTHPDDLEEGITLFRHLREQPGVTMPNQLIRFRHLASLRNISARYDERQGLQDKSAEQNGQDRHVL